MASGSSFLHHLLGGTGTISTISLFAAAAWTSGAEIGVFLETCVMVVLIEVMGLVSQALVHEGRQIRGSDAWH